MNNNASYRCGYCGMWVANTIDHIIPQSQNGSHDPVNLVWACKSCNCKKGARTPEQAGMILTMYPESIVKESYKNKPRISYSNSRLEHYVEIDKLRSDYPDLANRVERWIYQRLLLLPFSYKEWETIQEYCIIEQIQITKQLL
jgi:hypothetical protein